MPTTSLTCFSLYACLEILILCRVKVEMKAGLPCCIRRFEVDRGRGTHSGGTTAGAVDAARWTSYGRVVMHGGWSCLTADKNSWRL